jgi:hypothetical protein
MRAPTSVAGPFEACRLHRAMSEFGGSERLAVRTTRMTQLRHALTADVSKAGLGGTNRLGRDLARNIAAYPAFLPILSNLQEGFFCSLYLARFSRNQR